MKLAYNRDDTSIITYSYIKPIRHYCPFLPPPIPAPSLLPPLHPAYHFDWPPLIQVLEVFSGPPNVTFTWQHFGRLLGPFKDSGIWTPPPRHGPSTLAPISSNSRTPSALAASKPAIVFFLRLEEQACTHVTALLCALTAVYTGCQVEVGMIDSDMRMDHEYFACNRAWFN